MKKIKVLGPGCAKCKKLTDNVVEAIKQLGEEADFEYITDIQKIMEHGIMMTPALMIDDKIVSIGRVCTVKEILNYINS